MRRYPEWLFSHLLIELCLSICTVYTSVIGRSCSGFLAFIAEVGGGYLFLGYFSKIQEHKPQSQSL